MRSGADRGAAGPLWLVQASTGAALIILLGLHMIAHHFIVEGGLRSYQDVLAYLSDPLILALELLSLLVVTTHALLGVRAVIMDLGPGIRARRLVNAVLWLVGIGAVVYGVVLLAVILARG